MYHFKASLEIIGINPFVFIPDEILRSIFIEAKKEKGFIPICGTINGEKYIQTLLKHKGEWRLYINMTMLKDSPKRIGEEIDVTVSYDPIPRTIEPHPKLILALNTNKAAKEVFEKLNPSTQKEIIRYIAHLKTEQSVDLNIGKAIGFLLGQNKFIGRTKP